MAGPPRPFPAVIVLLCLCLTAACRSSESSTEPSPPREPTAAATPVSDVVAAVRERIELFDGIATGVVTLVRVGGETETLTRGRADVAREVPMGPDMSFPVASITKTMTAAVVMQLVEEGRLGLDDPAQTWLPELGNVRETITVEHLLSHQSGLRDVTDLDIRRHGSATEALLTVSASHPLMFEPGARGSYANVGYGALGLVVERILGKPLRQVFEERLFRPLGMGDSSLFGRADVHGYVDGEDWSDRYSLELLPAAGSVVASAADIDRFYSSLWAGEVVGPALVDQMRTPRGSVMFWDYGLGVAIKTVTCGSALGHAGRFSGISTEAWTLEGGERAVVVLVNDHLSDVPASIVETALCG